MKKTLKNKFLFGLTVFFLFFSFEAKSQQLPIFGTNDYLFSGREFGHKYSDSDTTDDPPVITSASSQQAHETLYFKYTATGTDDEDSTVTFAFDQLPSWLSSANDTVTGTPTVGKADTSFRIIASDGSLFDTLVVTVPVNGFPSITSVSPDTATEDIYFKYTATSTDADSSFD